MPGSLLPIFDDFVDCCGINHAILLQNDLSVPIKDHHRRDQFDAVVVRRFAPDLAQQVDPHDGRPSSQVLL